MLGHAHYNIVPKFVATRHWHIDTRDSRSLHCMVPYLLLLYLPYIFSLAFIFHLPWPVLTVDSVAVALKHPAKHYFLRDRSLPPQLLLS